jgi:hypothetical protein
MYAEVQVSTLYQELRSNRMRQPVSETVVRSKRTFTGSVDYTKPRTSTTENRTTVSALFWQRTSLSEQFPGFIGSYWVNSLVSALVSCDFYLKVVYCVSHNCAVNCLTYGEWLLPETVRLAVCMYLRVRLLVST